MKNNCAFCDRSQFEERIVGETDELWIIATLGQIPKLGGYVLVVPKHHVPCVGALVGKQRRIFISMSLWTSHSVAMEYQRSMKLDPIPTTLFEHGIVGQTVQHAHLHILPSVVDFTPKIRADFPEANIEELTKISHLQKSYGKNPLPYLYWTTPSGTAMVCWNPPAPNQYLRIVAAELLGKPERANWRTMDPELDRRLYLETVTRLKPYFL